MSIYWGFIEEEIDEGVKDISSAGILPYAVFKNRVFFLLGKETYLPGYQDSDKWGSFGGQLEADESIENGAAREFYEESAGCIMEMAEARQRLVDNDYLCRSDLHPSKSSSFRIYLMLVLYKDYPSIFRRIKHFVQYINGDVSLIEKSHLKWFTYKDVHDTVFFKWGANRYARKPKFRSKFSEMMRRIMEKVDLEKACIESYRRNK